jgi:uncharacterized GH25 family protein/predicted RNA-binding protein
MCEANVYLDRDGQRELVMEKVDRVVPGQDDFVTLENVFGERRMIKARILELELVHNRVILEAINENPVLRDWEIWLEPATDHGHFHSGEEVRLEIKKGYNMQQANEAFHREIEAYVVKEGQKRKVDLGENHGMPEINLGCEEDGLMTVYAHEAGDKEFYAKVIVEIGHHHHHNLEAIGLPLEIVPTKYSHVHLGDNYEIQVLSGGLPRAGVEVCATYTGSRGKDYPYHLVTDEAGKARVFLSMRGNWLFTVADGNIVSTFTLIKGF